MYLYEGNGKACAGQSKANEPPKFFSKVPKVLESDENFGNAPPIGSLKSMGNIQNLKKK